MKRSTKLAALCLAAVLCLGLLTGCHGTVQKGAFQVPEEFDGSRDYEISFWAKNDTNKTQVGIYKKAIEDFQSLYPNITVNLKLYTDYSKIYQDVLTNISTGTTPNVCITYPDHIATYLTGDSVVELDELFADTKFGLGGSELRFDGPAREEIVPEFLGECAIGEHTYALPFMRSTEACYVNADLLRAMGYEMPELLTWDFVWEVSEKAMEKNEDGIFRVNGQKIMIPFIYKSTDNMMITMLRQKNAGYSDASGNILMFQDTTKELLSEIAYHAGTRSFSTFKISSYPGNFLNAGQCIFAIDSTAGATWMGSEAPLMDIAADKIVPFETVVTEIPQFDPEHPQMISQGPSVCVFRKDDPQEVLASWLFTQYLLTNEVQIAYSGTEGYIPVTTKAQDSPEYQDYLSRSGEDTGTYYSVKIDAAKLLLKNTENTFVTPVFNGSASVREAAGEMIENVTLSVRRKQKVDGSYLDDLFDNMRSLYRLDSLGGVTPGRDLGPLPGTASALLISLGVTWAGIIAAASVRFVKDRKKKKE